MDLKELKTEDNKYFLCAGTHPITPNMSVNSRSRKYHITEDRANTLCNLIVSEIFEDHPVFNNLFHSQLRNGFCKICSAKSGLKEKD